MRIRPRFAASVCGLLAALAIACSGGSSSPSASSQPTSSSQAAGASGKLTVFAAASLTDAFTEIGAAFKAANPRADVAFNFQGSPTLRTQIEQGAHADIYASADQPNMMTALHNGDVVDGGTVFVRNSLTIIVPADNPAKIAAPADLAKPGLKLVLANASVPVGNYAHQMLGLMEKDPAYAAGFSDKVLKNLVSEESDVKQVVAKVSLGEADVGVVYGTDVTPSIAAKLRQIAVPKQFNVIAEYPIAVVKGADNAGAGQAFIAYVLSPAGQTILKKYGFQTLDQGS